MRRLVCLLLLCAPPLAFAGVPPWLRDLARESLPAYPADTKAVMLLDEHTTTVRDNGEIINTVRRAYKILRPQGRDFGHVVVHFDNDTRLTFLKAWCIPASGSEYEVKEKESIETSDWGEFYSDHRAKILTIPAADPGNVVGYEYEQKGRPNIYQESFFFQDPLPVRHARFVLRLPGSWEFSTAWSNYASRDPRTLGENAWAWEMDDVPALEPERQMPPWPSLGGRLVVNYFRKDTSAHRSWQEIGQWYANLAADRRSPSPQIRDKVAELTANASALLDKVRALALFAQRDIRYVAIEIGVGGYQPHPAAEVFTNRYGDCKDKATLLSAMLREIGVDSYYVLTHTDRGVILPGVPAWSFNHVILAIRLPAGPPGQNVFTAWYDHKDLGKLLLFDPTSRLTPFGFLPSYLEANYGLLVLPSGGELISLPVSPPPANRLLRTGELYLGPTGSLDGVVQEVRSGAEAISRRSSLLDLPLPERNQTVERQLAQNMTGAILRKVQLENLEDNAQNLIVRFQFVTPAYAKQAGNLLLLRPRVLGIKGDDIMESDKPRKFPVQFDNTSLQTDVYEIHLPPGFEVDEVPPPVQADFSFAQYRSTIEVNGRLLRYTRTFTVKELLVPTSRLEELKRLYRVIAGDERNNVVLKRTTP